MSHRWGGDVIQKLRGGTSGSLPPQQIVGNYEGCGAVAVLLAKSGAD